MLFLVLQTALLVLAAYILGAYCGSLLYRIFYSGDQPADAAGSGVAFSEQPFIELETGPPPPAPNLAVANRFERALLGTRQRERRTPRLDLVADVSQTSHAGELRPESEAQESAASPRLVQPETIGAIQEIEPAEASTASGVVETFEPDCADPAGAGELPEASGVEALVETIEAHQVTQTAKASSVQGVIETFKPADDPIGAAELPEASEAEGLAETIEQIQVTEADEASGILEAGETLEPAVAEDSLAPDLSPESTDVSDAFECVEAADHSETSDTTATRAMMKQPSSVQPGMAEPMQASNDHASLAPTLPVASSTGGITGTSAPLVVSAQQSADDLTRIHAIDPATAAQLAELGVNSYARLAAFTRADVDRIGTTIERARLWREGWIEQAQLLANGRQTAYARKIAGNSDTLVPFPQKYSETPTVSPSGGTSAEVPSPALNDEAAPEHPGDGVVIAEPVAHDAGSAPEARAIAGPEPVSASVAVAERVAVALPEPIAEFASAEPEIAPEVAEPLAAEDDGDDLTRIRGIDARAAAILRANGVTTFRHIADMRISDMRKLETFLHLPGQSRRHNWQKQARKLIKRGAAGTPPQRKEASEPAAAADLDETPPGSATIVAPAGSYEETAAELQVAGDADSAAEEQPALSANEAVLGDDLKRIRGIGTLIENKLNSLGICRYRQIANWTAPEIDRISQVLDFKGRIEREAWVEQARILVCGGRTEFSDRVDRR